MKDFTTKQICILIGIVAIMIITIGAYVYKTMDKDNDEIYISDNETMENEFNGNSEEGEHSEDKILVHVTGCVKDSGIVILNSGDRIIDAIETAGGETEDADLNKLNLAYILQDGEKLYVPSIYDNSEEEYITQENGDNIITQGAGNMSESKSEIININTATKEELMTLQGIGEATASKIVEYRKSNGNFDKIEDIKNVPGIGDAKFQNIKDKIKV